MKNRKIKSIVCGLSLTILTLCFMQGCGNGSGDNEKTLVMATSLDYPPFEYSEKGKPKGFDIDVAEALTKEMGYKLKIIDLDFSGLIPSLNAGRADFVMAGLSVTEEREKNLDFSDEYFGTDKNAIICKVGEEIEGIDALKNKTIGVQKGSVQDIYLREKAEEVPGLKIHALGKNPQLIQELKVGRIDGLMISEMQAKKFVDANEGLTYTVLPSEQGGIVIGFKKGSALKDEFNNALNKLKSSGELESIKAKWFKEE